MDISRISESRQAGTVEAIKKKIKSEPPLLGEHIGLPSGVVKRSSKQERIDYWTTDPAVLADPETYLQQAAQAAMETAKEGEPPETTIMRASGIFVHSLYPARLDLIRSGARGLSVKDQIKFADQQAELGPPTPEEYE
jgi:hypothetical protein